MAMVDVDYSSRSATTTMTKVAAVKTASICTFAVAASNPATTIINVANKQCLPNSNLQNPTLMRQDPNPPCKGNLLSRHLLRNLKNDLTMWSP